MAAVLEVMPPPVVVVTERTCGLARCQALVRENGVDRPCRAWMTWVRGGYGVCSSHSQANAVRFPSSAVRWAAPY